MEETIKRLGGNQLSHKRDQEEMSRKIDLAESTRQEANQLQTQHYFELRSMIERL